MEMTMNLTERQMQIVELAVNIIADDGIQALTMHRLADEVGVTEPALYRHFKSKREVLETIILLFDDIAQSVIRLVGDPRGLDRVATLLSNRYHMFAAHPKLTKVMMAEANFQFDKELSARVLRVIHNHRAAFADALAEAQNRGEVQQDIPVSHLFHILIGAVRLLVSRWCLSGFSFDLEGEGASMWESQKRLFHP